MAWFDDLSVCTYFPIDCGQVLRAVGWLAKGQAYPTGDVDPPVYRRLAELLRSPFQPFVACGMHECELCLYVPEARGTANLFVPGDGLLYVCPELILHYMNAHGYRPPKEFCDAVLRCPDTHTMDYKKQFLACGSRMLLKGS